MAIIRNYNLEDGTFGDATTNGPVSVSNSAALNGSNYGIAVDCNNTSVKNVTIPLGDTNESGIWRVRFYYKRNSLTELPSIYVYFLSSSRTIARVNFSGSTFRAGTISDTDLTNYTSSYDIDNEEHCVEVLLVRGTLSENGYLSLYLDNNFLETVTSNNDLTWDELSSIYINGTTVQYDTEVYLDEFLVNDDGSEFDTLLDNSNLSITVPSITVQNYALVDDISLLIRVPHVIALDNASITSTPQVITVDGGAIAPTTISLDNASVVSTGKTIFKSHGIIFDLDFEENDLSDFDWTTTDGGDLSTSADGLAGTNYKLNCLIDDTNLIHGYATISPNYSNVFRTRFYFDPNSIAWGNNTDCELMVLQTGNPEWGEVAIVKFGKDGSGNYEIHSMAQLDTTLYNQSTFFTITDAPHWIEIEVIVSDGSNNGRHRLWIDSLDTPLHDSGAVLDNDVRAAGLVYAHFGVFGSAPYSAPGGTLYLDELIVNDTGDPIGPLVTNITVSLDNAVITATPQASTLLKGEVITILDTAAITSLAQISSVIKGERIIVLDNASLSVLAKTIRKALWLIIDHETGDKTQYTGIQPSSAAINITTQSAMAGTTYGAEIPVIDTANRIGYYELSTASTTGIASGRFYININNLTIPDGGEFYPFSLYGSPYNSYYIASVYIQKSGGTLYVQAILFNDSGYSYTTTTVLSSGQHCIEIKVQRATGSGQTDGYLAFYLDGNLIDEVTGANYTRFTDLKGMGVGVYYPTNITGTLHYDEVIVNDTGDYIGLRVYNVTIPLDVATISVSAQNITVSVGEKITILSTALLVIAGQVLEANSGIPPPSLVELFVAQLTSSAQILSVIEGAVSVTLDNSLVSANGQALSVLKGEVTTQLDSSSVSANAGAITVGKGEVHLYFDSATLTATPNHVGLAMIRFANGFNDGTGNAWDSTVGSPTINTASALGQTAYGIECNGIDYYVKNFGAVGDVIQDVRFRFYFNLNDLVVGTSDFYSPRILQSYSGAVAGYLLIDNAGNHRWVSSDDTYAANSGDVFTIQPDTEYYIEVHYHRASANLATDGWFDCWVNGVQQTRKTGIDNYNMFPTIYGTHFGLAYWPSGTTGTAYFDEFVFNTTGELIGALPTTISLSSATVSSSAQAITLETPVTIPLANASISATGQIVTPNSGTGSTTISLTNATVTTSAQSITLDTPVTIDLSQANVSTTAQLITIVKGQATVSLTNATLTSSAQTIRKALWLIIDHETGDTSQYTTTVDPDGDELNVTALSALAGTNYGLAIDIDDTDAINGQYTLSIPSTTGRARARFYIDPNSITMGEGAEFVVCGFFNGALYTARVQLAYFTSSFRIRAGLYNDAGGTVNTSYYAITDAPHCVEIDLIRATTNSSADGSIALYIDGTYKGSSANADNYDRFFQHVTTFLSAQSFISTASGTFYLDELIVNDTGDLIGLRVYNVTIPLDSATISVSGQVSTIQKGSVTTLLDNALLTLTSQNITLNTPVVIPLDTANLTVTGQLITLSLGERIVSLSTGLLTVTPQPLTLIVGEATISLDNAVITITANALNVFATSSILLDAASVAITGQTLTVVAGERTISLVYGQIYTSEQTLQVVVGERTISLNNATVSVTAQPINVRRDVIIPLSSATVSVTGQQIIDILEGEVKIQFSNGTIQVSGQTITVVEGAVSTTLDSATIQTTANPLTLVAITTIPISTATITSTANSLTVIEGEATTLLDSASLTATGTTLAVTTIAPIYILLDSANLTATGQILTVVEGGIAIPLDTANLTVAPQTLTVAEGECTTLLDTAQITLTPQSLTVSVGGVTTQLDTATITLIPQILTVVEGEITIPLSYGLVTPQAQTLTVNAGTPPENTIYLSSALVNAYGQSLTVLSFVILRPMEDTSLGGWVDENNQTTDIYTSIDEITPDDNDFVRSPDLPTANTYKFKLEEGTDPEDHTNHIIRYRYAKPAGAGSVYLKIRVLEGTTTIVEWQDTVYETITQTEHEMTELQASAITDYANLFVELEVI